MADKPLTTGERNALPTDDFAVPGKRKLPIQDASHVAMAWKMVDRTAGLSADECKAARSRILARAGELGVDTADWHRIAAMRCRGAAVSLAFPDTGTHPNKMPFSGVMTKVGEPSDAAPKGSNGRRVVLTHEAAERALPGLLGMAVDLTVDLDDHDPQAKIGIITAGEIVGNDLRIEGFIYASDFPTEAARIQADKDRLGFSFETVDNWVADPGADPVEITDCTFTGAAILFKDKAAYRSTSLSASADEDLNMTPEELKALLDGAVKPLADSIAAQGERLTKIEAASSETIKKIEASRAVIDKVEPHAASLEAAADKMEADAIGATSPRGHATVLRNMAKDMRASAAMGKMPDTFSSYSMYASAQAEKTVETHAAASTTDVAKAIEDAVAKAVAPIQAAADKAKADLDAELASAKTKIVDLEAKAANTVTAPERKTLPSHITSLLAKGGIEIPGEGQKITDVGKIEKALEGLRADQRIEVKTRLAAAGLIA